MSGTSNRNSDLGEKQPTSYFRKIYNGFHLACSTLIGAIKFVLQIVGIYLLWIAMHYGAAHMYTNVCVPNTILGFILSPFMVVAPHCRALRWIVNTAAMVIDNMWIVFGTWVCAKVLVIPGNHANKKETSNEQITHDTQTD